MSDRQSVPDGALPVKADRRPYNFSTARDRARPRRPRVAAANAGDLPYRRRWNQAAPGQARNGCTAARCCCFARDGRDPALMVDGPVIMPCPRRARRAHR